MQARVNIGIALVTNPRVLFLDEPTSGLDSYTSNEVMTVVKGLTRTGITICATIHNPTPYCFNLFRPPHDSAPRPRRVQRRERRAARLCSLCLPVCVACNRVFSCSVTLLSCCERQIPARVPASCKKLKCAWVPAGPAAVRYFEQFPEVTPFGQRGSFPQQGAACTLSVLVLAGVSGIQRYCCMSWMSASAHVQYFPAAESRGLPCVLLQAEWIVDLTTRADREGKHAEYANRYDRSDLKVANLKELNMQIDRGYRVSACSLEMLLPSWAYLSGVAASRLLASSLTVHVILCSART